MGETEIPHDATDAASAVLRPCAGRSSGAPAPSGWIVAFAIPVLATLCACDPTVPAGASLGSHCSVQGDCPSGQVCVPSGRGGECQQSNCTSDDDCQPGQVCAAAGGGQGACESPEPDASTGDGSATATTMEGGQHDGSTSQGPDVYAPADARDVAVGDALEWSAESGRPDSGPAPDESPDDGGGDGDANEVAVGCDGGAQPSTLVLFGGVSATAVLGDTWVWDGQSWSNRDADAGPTGSPPARQQAAMSTACGCATLVGGTGAAGNWLSDAWLWNGATWRQASSSPPARENASAATLGTTMYLFGGEDSAGDVVSDLYAWNGGNWSLALQSGSGGPAGRNGAAFVNDPGARAALLLFGGFDIAMDAFNDAWSLTDASWQIAGDAGASSLVGRAYAAAAPWQASVVVFGGQDADGDILNETLIWDGSTWTAIASQPNGPAARYEATMANLNGQVVLFGGFDSNGTPLGDTWFWNGSWSPGPSAGPPARTSATMTAY